MRPRGGGSSWPTAQFEATLLNAGHEARAVRAGAHVLGVVSDVVRPYLGTVLATRADVDTPALRALLDAWDDAERAVLAPDRRADVLALLSAQPDTDREIAEQMYATLLDPLHGICAGGAVEPGRVRGGPAAARRAGRFRVRPRPGRAVPPRRRADPVTTDTQVVATDLPRGHLRALQAVNTGQLARPVGRRAHAAGDRGRPAHLGRRRPPSPRASTSSATACCSRCGASSWPGSARSARCSSRWSGAAAAGLLSALSPGVVLLVVLRGIAGGFFGGAVPATLVYVGATVPIERRQQPLTDLMAGVAVGMAAATVAAGWAAQLVSWRAMFAVTAVAAAVLALYIRRLPEPPRAEVRAPAGTRPGPGRRATGGCCSCCSSASSRASAITGSFTFVAPGVAARRARRAPGSPAPSSPRTASPSWRSAGSSGRCRRG